MRHTTRWRQHRLSHGRMVSAVVGGLGLMTALAGTFLPWVRSGEVERNSYEIAAVLDNLGVLSHPLVAATLRAWVAVPLGCALCAGLFIFGLRRFALGVTVIVCALLGTVATVVYVQAGAADGVITVAATGPAITAVGSTVAVTGALGATFRRRTHVTITTLEQERDR